MTRELMPCGTYAAYARHLRHGEEPCAECKKVSRNMTRRARGGGAPQRDIGHRADQRRFAERVATYTELRRGGASVYEAADAVGVDPTSTGLRYERWFKAAS